MRVGYWVQHEKTGNCYTGALDPVKESDELQKIFTAHQFILFKVEATEVDGESIFEDVEETGDGLNYDNSLVHCFLRASDIMTAKK